MMTLNFEKPILIDLPMPIETDRLIIREPRAGDGQALYDAKMETWDALNQWMLWAKNKGTVEQDEIVCRQAHIKFLQREDMMMFAFDKKTGQLVGGTGLHRFDWDTRIIEIGYWYRQSIQEQGLATEGTKALIKYAFDVCQATKVIIPHAINNDKSRSVIKKCGLKEEFTSRQDHLLPDGTMTDLVTHSCFNANHLSDFNVTWGKLNP